jgi:transglutaminase-like putative cysteine protease
MKRRTLAFVVLGTWIGSLGWLVQRQYFRSTGARLAEAALAIPPGARYYRLATGEGLLGFASTTIDTLSDSIKVDDVLVLDVAATGRLYRTTSRSTAIVGRTLRMQSLNITVDGDDGQFDAMGRVQGDSLMRMSLVSGGDSNVARVRVDHAPVIPSLLALRLAFGGELRVGRRYRVQLFDPITLAERVVALRVAAETTLVVSDSAAFDSTANVWVAVQWDSVPSFRLDVDSGPGDRLWIDAQGQLVRLEQSNGMVMERAAFEIAYENFRHRDTAAVARASRVQPGATVAATALAAGAPVRAARLQQFRVVARGVDARRLGIEGRGQTVKGDTIEIQRPEQLGAASRFFIPVRDSSLLFWLRPEPLIQSNDFRIEARARQIVGRERNATRVTERLLAWVGGLRRAPTTGVPNAAGVLAAGAGDCNEMTVLFVALARAVGLPARPVTGLLWRGQAFYYHAWAEVYIGEWVAVDPLLGELPADAGRVRLGTGNLARRPDLTRLIGNLKLEKL